MENNLENRIVKINSRTSSGVTLKVIPGHFATNHSHINYYIDMTTLKTRQSEAAAVAKSFVNKYSAITVVDTIVCMDGCEVIGAYLADELTRNGVQSMNAHKTIYVVSPEYDTTGQMIFRDNIQPMIREKNIILLVASATTGKTIRRCLECLEYYGGKIKGISAIFSAVSFIEGIEVDSIFQEKDVPQYNTYNHADCPFCKKGERIEALVNSFGYSAL